MYLLSKDLNNVLRFESIIKSVIKIPRTFTNTVQYSKDVGLGTLRSKRKKYQFFWYADSKATLILHKYTNSNS